MDDDDKPCSSSNFNKKNSSGRTFNGLLKVEEQQTPAKRCWALIAESISKKRKLAALSNSSSFEASDEFFTYLLYSIEKLPDESPDGSWIRISWNDYPDFRQFDVHIYDPVQVSLHAIMGFNNTGNIRIWPSEECLAYFLLKNSSRIEEKTVLELGAGMTGLAGLVASVFATHVHISDGNEKSIENLVRIISKNNIENASIRCIKWEENSQNLKSIPKFDVIISGDCLFFMENHQAIINCFDKFLKNNGEIFLMSPERKGSLRRFLSLIIEDNRFNYEFFESFDNVIDTKIDSKLDGFVEDLHRIKLIVLKRVDDKY